MYKINNNNKLLINKLSKLVNILFFDYHYNFISSFMFKNKKYNLKYLSKLFEKYYEIINNDIKILLNYCSNNNFEINYENINMNKNHKLIPLNSFKEIILIKNNIINIIKEINVSLIDNNLKKILSEYINNINKVKNEINELINISNSFKINNYGDLLIFDKVIIKDLLLE